MPQLSPEGQRAVTDIAQRTRFSPEAVATMLFAVIAGSGTMAQFSHPEFGGSGQWMAGGSIMLSDMFNTMLKARVDGLCNELAALVLRDPGLVAAPSFQSQSQGGEAFPHVLAGSSLLTPQVNWWPADFGAPASVGAQNSARYAYFPQARRLAIDIDGKVTVYDTQDHQIGGVSQQQSGSGSVTFTSQYGNVDLASLRVVSGDDAPVPPPAQPAEPPLPVPPPAQPAAPPSPAAAGSHASGASGHAEILSAIERLADLRARGILTEGEFVAKKTELLARL